MNWQRGLVWLALCMVLASPDVLADDIWSRYKARFVTDDGRVVDTGNADVSHSEGQGWGMLLAEAHGDRATFDRLWQWTRRHLARQDMALFSWRYDPYSQPHVQDPNNASDGDLLIAWALQRAGQRWDDRNYANAARHIRTAIRDYLTYDIAGYRVLLPGVQGFVGEDHVDVNLSYWVMPALQAFAEAEPEAGWQRLVDDGRRLLAEGRFGRYALPTDWVRLTQDVELAPAPQWPARFGFDAVRIPLYFVWGGLADEDSLATIAAFWNDPARQPPAAWINVYSEAQAEYAASDGVLAIRALLDDVPARIPDTLASSYDYYTASLVSLTRLAAGLTP